MDLNNISKGYRPIKWLKQSFFLKKFAKVVKASSATKKDAVVGTVTMADCEEIARIKMQDLNANDIAAGAKIIAGTAESMGIEVIKS